MANRMVARGLRIGVLLVVFGSGFLLGSVSQRSANAQLGDLGKAALEKAAGSGGAVGTVMQLGSAIVEMQQHVDGLQKNLDTLKKVKAALGQ